MRRIEDRLWVWLLPDREAGEEEKKEWLRHGGKWIVFDSRERIETMGGALGPFIDSGEIVSAKYWRGDPSAINVYSLDHERARVLAILEKAGAGRSRVWEYDYAWDRNLRTPFAFVFSWCSKFSTILRSYGIGGAVRLFREIILRSSGSDDE